MKKKKNKGKNKRNLIFRLISIFLIISAIIFGGLICYFEILPIQYLSLFIIVLGLITFFLASLLNKKRLKKWVKVIISIPSLIISIVFIIFSLYLFGTLDFLDDILDVGIRSDSYSVYVLDSSHYENIDDLNDKIIGVSSFSEEATKKAVDKVSKKIEYNVAKYDNIVDSIDDVITNDIDAVLALDSNIDILKEENEDYSKLKPIYTFNVTTKVDTLDTNIDVSKNNFVVYLSGIDVSGKVASKSRSDVNIIVAINPNKKKILMLNTPRDYYVKLASKKAMDKLTHAGVYGIEESVATLEDLYDIDINYYARVNFTSFMKIVESLKGIEVDVPVSFCEQTSSRTSNKKICLKKGLQKLNGEQALALARTRHTLSGGDRSRIENQLLILKAIIDKAMSPSIIVTYNDLLNSLSDSVITNISQKDLTKLIKKQISSNAKWTIDTFTVEGKDSYKTTYSTGNAKAYVMEPDEESVLEAKKLLDEILETNKYTEDKES